MRHRDALCSLSVNPSNLLVAGACLRQQALDFLPGPVVGSAVRPAGEGAMRLGLASCGHSPPDGRLGALGAAWWPCTEARGWRWC